MPAAKAAASAAVHAAVAAVTWRSVVYSVEVIDARQEVAAHSVEQRAVAAAAVAQAVRHGVFLTTLAHTIRAELVPDEVVRIDDAVFAFDQYAFKIDKLLEDAIFAQDVCTPTLVYVRNFADSVGAVDQVTVTLMFLRDLADAITAIDARVVALSLPKADSVTVADVATKDYGQAFADEVFVHEAVTEDVIIQDLDKLVVEAVTVTDARAVDLTTPRADAVVASDASSRDYVFGTLAEIVTALDTRTVDFGKALTDSVVTADSAVMAQAKNLADAVTVADAITSFSHDRVLADSIVVVEAKAVDFTKDTFVDSVAAVDVPTFGIGYFRSFGCEEVSSTLNGHMLNEWQLHVEDQCEHVIAADSIPIFSYARVMAGDTVTPTDAIARDYTQGAFSDSVTATDAQAKDFIRGVIAEVASATDAVTIALNQAVADSVVVVDLAIVAVGGRPEFNERLFNDGEFN